MKHYKLSTDQLTEIKDKLASGQYTLMSVRDEYTPGYRKDSFLKLLERHGIAGLTKQYKEQRNKKIVEAYNTKQSIDELANQFTSGNLSSLYGILRKLGLSKKHPSFNQHAFDGPLKSEQQLFYFGLLLADGSCGSKKKSVELQLTEPSMDLLLGYTKFIQLNRPPRFSSKAVNSNCRDSYSVNVGSKHLHKRLVKLGCVPRKTYYLKFPRWVNKLNDKQFSWLVRGYVSGNGSWTFNGIKYPSPVFSIGSTRPFLKGIAKLLKKKFKCHVSLMKNGQRTHDWDLWSGYLLSISGPPVIQIGEWLYPQDAMVHDQNKEAKFNMIKKWNIK